MLINKFRIMKSGNFHPVRPAPKRPGVDLRRTMQRDLEACLVMALLLVIGLFIFFPRFSQPIHEIPPQPYFVLTVESIPATRQHQKPPPLRPAVPIEAEEDLILDDIEVEMLEFNEYNPTPPAPEFYMGSGKGVSIGPKLIKQVFPVFTEKEKKKRLRGRIDLSVLVDVRGRVKDVKVINNTTNNAEIENAAVDAAYKCLYISARLGNIPVEAWTMLMLTIDFSK